MAVANVRTGEVQRVSVLVVECRYCGAVQEWQSRCDGYNAFLPIAQKGGFTSGRSQPKQKPAVSTAKVWV